MAEFVTGAELAKVGNTRTLLQQEMPVSASHVGQGNMAVLRRDNPVQMSASIVLKVGTHLKLGLRTEPSVSPALPVAGLL